MSNVESRNIDRRGWYLYDFGNSIIIINGGLYFPQWLVTVNGIPDVAYNLFFVISSIIVLLVAPIIGLSADYKGTTFRYLVSSSIWLALSGFAVGIAPFISNWTIRIVVASAGFLCVLISYQISLVFYNTLLGAVARPGHYENVSGRGLAWGWLGGIVGIIFGLPFSVGGPGSGVYSLLPSALVTTLLMAVSLYLMSRPRRIVVGSRHNSLDGVNQSVRAEFANIRNNSTVLFFLLAFFLFSDAILTIQNNSTIYMEVVLKLTDRQKAYEFLLILVTSALGSLGSAFMARVLGLRRALSVVIAGCTIVVAMAPILTNPVAFTAILAVLGLLNGGVWNLSRVVFFELIPHSRRNTYFGFYSTFERFSSIVGPLAWSLFLNLVDEQVLRYQIAWAGMSIFLLVSLALLRKVRYVKRKEPPSSRQVSAL